MEIDKDNLEEKTQIIKMIRMTELLAKYHLSHTKAIAASGDTILHLVVMDEEFTEQETVEILKKLLNYGLDPNSGNKLEETVLHLAIKTRARDIIDLLMSCKVDLDNSAALHLIENEYNKLLGLIKQSSISEDGIQKKESDSASFLEWMITKGLNIDLPNRFGQSALFLAIDYGLLHLLTVSLKYTTNINYLGYKTKRTLLHMVLESKSKTRWSPSYSQRYSTSVVKILLDRGVSPESADKFLNTALHLAIAESEGVNVVQMLIDDTTYLNHKNTAGETPLSIAIRKCLNRRLRNNVDDYRKIFQTLIMKGADVNEESNLGFRPLHIFAKETGYRNCLDEEEVKLFEMLISVGCNLNAKNSRDETPLHIAGAGTNKTAVRKPSVNNGTHIILKNDGGAEPLHFISTCKETVTDITGMLIELGANVNARDFKGFTPLHKAANNQECYPNSDNTARLKLLLEYGAEFSRRSKEGYSVLHIGVWKYDSYCIFDPQESDDEPLRLEDVSESDFFSRTRVCSLTAQLRFLLNHWIKLYVAKLGCRMGNLFKTQHIKVGLKYYPASRQVYGDCMKEIKILKNTFIDDNRTSIYAFIHMNLDSRRALIYNKKLQELVQSPLKLEKQFPEYAIFILSSYNETIRRKSLMEPAKIAWIKLTEFNMGDLCIENVFSFLSNAELYELIEAAGN